MSGLNCDTCAGTLIGKGINLHTPAWCVDSAALFTLLRFDLRGDYGIVPPDEGQEPDGLVVDMTEHSLPITIAGETDRLGNPYVNPWNGLYTNLRYLFDNIVEPPGTVRGSGIWVYNPPDATPLSAEVQVLDLRYPSTPITDEDHGPVLVGSLELLIVSGRFV